MDKGVFKLTGLTCLCSAYQFMFSFKKAEIKLVSVLEFFGLNTICIFTTKYHSLYDKKLVQVALCASKAK